MSYWEYLYLHIHVIIQAANMWQQHSAYSYTAEGQALRFMLTSHTRMCGVILACVLVSGELNFLESADLL